MLIKPTGDFTIAPDYIDPDGDFPRELWPRLAKNAAAYIQGTFEQLPVSVILATNQETASVIVYMTGFDSRESCPAFVIDLSDLIQDYLEVCEPEQVLEAAERLEALASKLRNSL